MFYDSKYLLLFVLPNWKHCINDKQDGCITIKIKTWKKTCFKKWKESFNPFATMGVVNDPLYLILSGGAIFESFTAIFGMWGLEV